jgi:hypothetical protein
MNPKLAEKMAHVCYADRESFESNRLIDFKGGDLIKSS